jgi:hypothetical protein
MIVPTFPTAPFASMLDNFNSYVFHVGCDLQTNHFVFPLKNLGTVKQVEIQLKGHSANQMFEWRPNSIAVLNTRTGTSSVFPVKQSITSKPWCKMVFFIFLKIILINFPQYFD